MESTGRTLKVYAVKDELTNRFMQPIYCQNDKEAERWFYTQVNEISLWKSNASDYSLNALGTFNEETGEFCSNVEKLQNGSAVVERR